MRLFHVAFFVLLVSTVGCGKKESGPTDSSGPPPGYSGSKGAPPGITPGAPAGKLNEENLKRIQQGIGVFTLNDVKQAFGSEGEATNDEKQGLAPGSSKYVWKEDKKKVYVSFGQDGKANGVSWEGFGGK